MNRRHFAPYFNGVYFTLSDPNHGIISRIDISLFAQYLPVRARAVRGDVLPLPSAAENKRTTPWAFPSPSPLPVRHGQYERPYCRCPQRQRTKKRLRGPLLSPAREGTGSTELHRTAAALSGRLLDIPPLAMLYSPYVTDSPCLVLPRPSPGSCRETARPSSSPLGSSRCHLPHCPAPRR